MKTMKRRVELSTGWAEADVLDGVWVGDRWTSRVIEVTFPGVEGQPGLSMTIDSSTGVPRCTRLEIASTDEGREVRTSDMRAVEIPNWLEAIVPLFMSEAERSEDGGVGLTIASTDETAQIRRSVNQLRTAQRADRRVINDDLLRRVAEVYQSDPVRPAAAVQRAFRVSQRTAFRYIRMARDNGLLAEKG